MPEMNVLKLNGTEYEIADKKARESLSALDASSSIVCTVSGSSIPVSDSADRPLPGLKLFGKTVQQTTTGKNLFDKTNVLDGYGIGSGGTPYPDEYLFSSHFIPVVSGTTYTLLNAKWLNYYDADGKNLSQSTAPTFTVPDGAAQIRFSAEKSDRDIVQLELGSAATTYEPYTGGKPSPSPEYPQALHSIGDGGSVGLTVAGGNLLPYPYVNTTKTENGATFTANNDGSVSLSGAATGYVDFYFYNGPVSLFPKQITFSLLGSFENVIPTVSVFDESGARLFNVETVERNCFIDCRDYPTAAPRSGDWQRCRDSKCHPHFIKKNEE